MRLLLLLVVLAGCGGPATWKVDCIEIEVPMAELERGAVYNLDNMTQGVAFAKALFDGKYGDGQFCARADGIIVELRRGSWKCSSPLGCDGEWILEMGRVRTRDSGIALLHEFFHVQDSYEWRPGTSWHENWDRNANYLLSGIYEEFISRHPWRP
jgi:hypothetical protein